MRCSAAAEDDTHCWHIHFSHEQKLTRGLSITIPVRDLLSRGLSIPEHPQPSRLAPCFNDTRAQVQLSRRILRGLRFTHCRLARPPFTLMSHCPSRSRG